MFGVPHPFPTSPRKQSNADKSKLCCGTEAVGRQWQCDAHTVRRTLASVSTIVHRCTDFQLLLLAEKLVQLRPDIIFSACGELLDGTKKSLRAYYGRKRNLVRLALRNGLAVGETNSLVSAAGLNGELAKNTTAKGQIRVSREIIAGRMYFQWMYAGSNDLHSFEVG